MHPTSKQLETDPSLEILGNLHLVTHIQPFLVMNLHQTKFLQYEGPDGSQWDGGQFKFFMLDSQ